MAGSVGGSGGQISVSSAGAGEDSAAGGQVDFIASAATAFGVSVIGAADGGSVIGASDGGSVSAAVSAAASPAGAPGGVCTGWAPPRGCFFSPPFSPASVFDQSGAPLLF